MTTAGHGADASAPLARRRRVLVAVLGLAVAIAVAGLSSPLWIKSPQQLAAEAKAPPPSVITAPVERRVLRDVLVVRGDVRAAQTLDVTPGSSTGSAAIVTKVKVGQGDTVKAGTVVLEVSGRPLIVFRGATPAYRDLKPGAEGEDVAQLQAALAKLGYAPGDRAGRFGSGTKWALTDFYRSRGYEPLPTNENDEDQLRASRAQVTAAERQVQDARDAVDALDEDSASTDQQKRDAAKALTRAKEDLALARDELARLEATTGPMLPQSEYVFLPSFPARVDGLTAVVGAQVEAPLVTFATGELVVAAELTAAQRTLCQVGAPVEISGDGGLDATGSVTMVGDLAQSPRTGNGPGDESAGAGHPVVVTPAAPLDPQFAGQNVRLNIEVATSGDDELVVPVAALYLAADGSVSVNKRVDDAPEQRVVVEPGMSAQGYVVVTVVSGQLDVGDLVAVGEGPSG